MNYRHIYHAGHLCDVVKHAAYALLLEYLKRKDKPFAVLDTHAGCGLYDLQDERALKTNEAQHGVLRLWDVAAAAQEPLLQPYFDVLRALNPDGAMRFYPGSPLVARRLLRPQDRLVACELHPEDSRDLRRLFHEDKQAQVHERDGYEALKAFLPFPEKRGLILIDPPFEEPGEFDALAAAAQTAHERMPGAVLAMWYPIKERPAIWRFHETLAASGLPKLLKAEYVYRPEVRGDQLNGTGLIVMNTPWHFEDEMARLLSALHVFFETETPEAIVSALTPL